MTELKTKTNPAIAAASAERAINPSLIDGVEVALDGFLGSARMTVGELTGLTKGAVVTLDAPLNGMVDLRLNGVQVGRGELVAVGNHFAVRLTEFAS
ncbi:MAG: FliM/FliN family flagellar motor switch protein [Sphingomonas sp.]|uniref:FliM/FliN family flagellar motor switch protein n=1 Tax=Sphingomonas sp. TaxID=28214 RepID=UPI003565A92B